RLRNQALTWLRADLDCFNKWGADRGVPFGDPRGTSRFWTFHSRLDLIERLAHAQKDPDFKGVRDSLATLPDSEQAAWRKLWDDTDQLLKQARGSVSQTTLQGVLTDKAHQQSHDQQLQAGKEYVIDMTSKDFDTYLKFLD